MISSTSSAPGKVILFGEHAVVYGVTAIASALSDLRIFVEIESTFEDVIHLYLHDIKTSEDDCFEQKIAAKRVLELCALVRDPLIPVSPNESVLENLRNYFTGESLPATQGLMATSYLCAAIVPELLGGEVGRTGDSETTTEKLKGCRIHVRSVGLPIGAGLGSSAAFSVALAGALLQLRQKLLGSVCAEQPPLSTEGVVPPIEVLKVINGWAYAAEVVIHGSPSGLDNTTSCYGGAVKYIRSSGTFENLPSLPPLQILLINTKVPRSTKALVAAVRKLHDSIPSVIKPILESIEGISQKFLSLIDSAPTSSNESFESEVSELVRINHALLCALGVGHSSLTTVVEESDKAGFASKLTGAGGGGCAITVIRNNEDEGAPFSVKGLTDKLESLGFDTFQSTIAGDGVRWHV